MVRLSKDFFWQGFEIFKKILSSYVGYLVISHDVFAAPVFRSRSHVRLSFTSST